MHLSFIYLGHLQVTEQIVLIPVASLTLILGNYYSGIYSTETNDIQLSEL